MSRDCRRLIVLVAVLVGLPSLSEAQGSAALSGLVTDPSGLAVAGAAISVSAGPPASAPLRTIVSDRSGAYSVAGLPAGEYWVVVEFEGFRRAERYVSLVAGGAITLDVQLELGAIPQVVKVTREVRSDPARAASPGEFLVPGETVQTSPVGRTPEDVAQMAPGVTTSGPNRAMTMAGAFSFGNLFLVDNLVANDSTRGGARGFYIADAVAETRVITGAIPAEFGRLQGGVVQTITRSGGNTVTGTVRIGLTNDNWRALTPYRGDATLNRRVPTWEFTVGGPVVRSKLFYFGGAMGSGTEQNRTLAYTGGSYVYTDDEQRYEAKVTWNPARSQTVRATYFHIESSRTNVNAGVVMDRESLYDTSSPESLAGVSYNRLFGTVLFEARYSDRRLTASGSGAHDTTLTGGTPIWDRSKSDARFQSPAGCAVCPGSADERDSQDLGATIWFARRGWGGSHDFTVGVDVFRETRQTNAYQSGSGYRVRATRSVVQGSNVFPVFLADRTTWIYWTPLLTDSTGNDLRTYSAFVSDAWRVSPKVTVRAGVRFDYNDDLNSVGQEAAHDAAWSPRLGVTWDPSGAGRWLVSAGWSRYVAAINSAVADAASPGGRTATYIYDYLGPAVNASGTGKLTAPTDALSTLFTWFLAPPGVGRPTRSAPSIPGLTVEMDPALAPLDTREFMAGVTRQLGRRGSIRAEGVYRRFLNFYATRRDMTTGKVAGPGGVTNDLTVVTNAHEGAERTYLGLLTQVVYRPATRLQVSASYTLSSTYGNVDGEDAAVGPTMVTLEDYPEYRDERWNAPMGPLAIDQRHRLRLWVTCEVPMPPWAGRLTAGLVQRVEAGAPWSAVGSINPRAYVANPGYATPPTSVSYYFSERGAFHTETLAASDLSWYWSRSLPRVKRGQWFVRALLANAFNRGAAIRVNRTVLTNLDSTTYKAFNPFTATPVSGVHFAYGPDFGKPINATDYQPPRESSVSFGIRY